jgi:hypothetical protein
MLFQSCLNKQVLIVTEFKMPLLIAEHPSSRIYAQHRSYEVAFNIIKTWGRN